MQRLEHDKVVVFPRKALKPWDNMLSFSFLDFNPNQSGNDGLDHRNEKLKTKDAFVGQINQVKTTIAQAKKKDQSLF